MTGSGTEGRDGPETPLLSFICTVKNGERYLEDCIASVYEHHAGTDMVIVDDGSSDGTSSILERWERKEPSLRVLRPGAVGRGAALNLAVKACVTPYLANIDADDLVLPGRLDLVDHLERSPATVALAAGESALLFSDNGEGRDGKTVPTGDDALRFQDVSATLHLGNPLSHIGVVMRRAALLAVGGYDESRRSQFDFELWTRLVKRGYRLHRANVAVSVKRLHDRQSFERSGHVMHVMRGLPLKLSAAEGWRESLATVSVFAFHITWATVPRWARLSMMRWDVVRRVGKRSREGKNATTPSIPRVA